MGKTKEIFFTLLKWLIIVLIFYWAQIEPINSATLNVELKNDIQRINLAEYIEIFEDPIGKLSITDILNKDNPKHFHSCVVESCDLGYKKSTYWVRVTLTNNYTSLERWVLENAYEKIGKDIKIFILNNSKNYNIEYYSSLFFDKYEEIKSRNRTYAFTIKRGETKTVYIKIKNETYLNLKLLLWTENSFKNSTYYQPFLFGGIWGILLVLILYNFALFYSFQDISYLFFNILLSVIGLVGLIENGNGVLPDKLPLEFHIFIWMPAALAIGLLLFTMSFLQLSVRHKFINIFCHSLILLLVSICLICSFSDSLAWIKFRSILCAISSISVFLIAIYVLIKGYKPAKFFVFSMFPAMSFSLLPILSSFSLLPESTFTTFGLDIGIIVTIFLFSLVLVSRINTTRLEKEKAQKEAIEVYKKTEKIKDEFLANTSHELRTPIHGIIGIADSLLDGIAGNLSTSVKENLQLVVHSGKRLSNLVNDILDYSRLKNKDLEIKKEPVNIKQIVDIVIQVCHPLANKNVVIKNQISNDTPAVVGDEDRLQQIMFNLLGNAIKFTEKGRILVSAKIVNSEIVVMVSDTGEGIPPEKLNSVFEEFEQVDSSASRKFGGTGIGLSITKKLIELHGGTISLTSVVGQGSQFTFFLPLSNEQTERKEIDVISSKITSLQLEPVPETSIIEDMIYYKNNKEDAFRVLVVDDDAINRTVTSNYLALYNYEVQIASSGKEALQIIENNPKPNIVLLDLMMPDMTGFEVTGKIREQYSLESLPIIIVTAVNRVKDFVMALQSGANDYITKPFNNDELITRIKLHRQLYQINLALKDHQENLENQVDLRTAEIRKLMENIKESRDIAIAANKAKSEFLANMSHELRTPMHGLLGFAKLGKTKFNNNDIDKLGNYLDEIVASGERLLALLNDLLDLSKHAAEKIQYDFKKAQLIEIIKLIESESIILMSEKGIDFRYGNLPEIDFVYIDHLRMGQVVRNLFSNAIKFSNPKGKIIVDIFNENDYIIFTLTDNGIGIPENELESIFDEFVQSSYSITGAGGTGLGLSICKRIVTAHNGHIWAESNPDGGAIMKFRIPLYQES